MSTVTYRIDIDGTVAYPRFFEKDLLACCQRYIDAGIVQQEEVLQLQWHQQLFLLPHVLLTHIPIPGSVETLNSLVAAGTHLQYFTVRQALQRDICMQVHENTRIWLAQNGFPCSQEVSFFWNAGEKLRKSLQAQEHSIFLIDDRPEGLVQAYEKIALQEPDVARQICERVVLVAFGSTSDLVASMRSSSGLNVITLTDWSNFETMHIKEFKSGSTD